MLHGPLYTNMDFNATDDLSSYDGNGIMILSLRVTFVAYCGSRVGQRGRTSPEYEWSDGGIAVLIFLTGCKIGDGY